MRWDSTCWVVRLGVCVLDDIWSGREEKDTGVEVDSNYPVIMRNCEMVWQERR